MKRLQQLLNSDPDTAVATSGVGSAGSETDFYGSLTEKAVQKFQLKHGVVSSSSDAGYGYVGPKTRAKLAEVFGE
ncbi:MAG: peptidoglycan-binding domain-containing protein [Candidatus Pacebacteria bacterium]|nr:peptidoglycan-binding domain-containing protein [Candidatus Paceibacterota bacterium]